MYNLRIHVSKFHFIYIYIYIYTNKNKVHIIFETSLFFYPKSEHKDTHWPTTPHSDTL